jgi:hypothetical protein
VTDDRLNVRLQGGPFDGERQRNLHQEELPARMWVMKCWNCGSHWLKHEQEGAEPYDRDDFDERGWLVYVWTDPQLQPPPLARERELVPAGGFHDDELEDA